MCPRVKKLQFILFVEGSYGGARVGPPNPLIHRKAMFCIACSASIEEREMVFMGSVGIQLLARERVCKDGV